MDVCKLLAESTLEAGTGMGGLWITGGRVADGGLGAALPTEAVTCAGAGFPEASFVAVQVRIGLIEGALTAVAGVFGGAVLVAEAVTTEEDVSGAEGLVNAT